jgi:hypothetical protein
MMKKIIRASQNDNSWTLKLHFLLKLILIHNIRIKTWVKVINLTLKEKIALLEAVLRFSSRNFCFHSASRQMIRNWREDWSLCHNQVVVNHFLQFRRAEAAVNADISIYSKAHPYSDHKSMFCYFRTKKNNIDGQSRDLSFNKVVFAYSTLPLKTPRWSRHLPDDQTHSVYLDGPDSTPKNIQITLTKNNLTKNYQERSAELGYMFVTIVSYSILLENYFVRNRETVMNDADGQFRFLHQS